MDQQGPRDGRPRWLLAVLTLAVAIASAVLLVHRYGSSSPTHHKPAAAGPPFAGTPAARWKPAADALVLPTARRVGPYSKAEVHGALGRARTFLLTARTDPRVLVDHEFSSLARLTSAGTERTQEHLYATFLAPRNAIAAPVRLTGSASLRFVPATGRYAEHLVVSAKLVWGYYLTAAYDYDTEFHRVVTQHDHIELAFYLDRRDDGPHAPVTPQADRVVTYDMDCGYANDNQLGLPRADDPELDPAGSGDTSGRFDPNANVDGHGRGCLPPRH